MSGLSDLRNSASVARMVRGAIQMSMLRGGLESGLFEALQEPKTAAVLADERGYDRDLTSAWLHAALENGLLELGGNAYTVSPLVRWLLESETGDSARATIEEAFYAYGPVLERYADWLPREGAERPAWNGNPDSAQRVARGSRLLENRAIRALGRLPGVRQARRILDIGCGEGHYLLALLKRYRDAIGDAVELDESVVARARTMMAEAGLERRAEIHAGDFAEVGFPHGSYDLVMLNNNLYYFAEEEREPLFRSIYEHLVPNGTLAIQSTMVSDDPVSRFAGMTAVAASFDAFLQAHTDLAGLPDPDELAAQLHSAGFDAIGSESIVPGGSVRYVWARKPKKARAERS